MSFREKNTEKGKAKPNQSQITFDAQLMIALSLSRFVFHKATRKVFIPHIWDNVKGTS